jgi:RNA polymerase-binding transcription factor DksA
MATKSIPNAAAKKGVKSAKSALPKKSAVVKNRVAAKSKAKSVKAPIVAKSKAAKTAKVTKAAPGKSPAKPAAKTVAIKKSSLHTPTPKPVVKKPVIPVIVNPQNKKVVTKESPEINHPPKNNGKGRYSDKELAEFRVIVDEKLQTSRQELNYLQEQIVEMNENNADIQGSDWFDDSSIHSEVELLNNMAIRQRQFIQNLENALVRIENKTYGICTVTGNLIDKKRLLLVPHATKSIEAKHIEQASMVPDINQVSPDERVIRRSVEGKQLKKAGVKKSKSKSSKDFEDEDGEEIAEVPLEDMDVNFGGGDD